MTTPPTLLREFAAELRRVATPVALAGIGLWVAAVLAVTVASFWA